MSLRIIVQYHYDHTDTKICIISNSPKILERPISQLNCRDKIYHQELFNFNWLSRALTLLSVQDFLTIPATTIITVSCLN